MARSSGFTESQSTRELTANLDPDEIGPMVALPTNDQRSATTTCCWRTSGTHYRFEHFSDDLGSG
jgi:hypothetical protein